MRTVFGGFVVALALATQPALAMGFGGSAGEGAASAGAASLPIAAAAAPAVLPTFVAAAALPAVAAATPVATGYRLGVLTATAAARPMLGLVKSGEGALRRRLIGAMTDFHPFAGSGFTLSAGPRLFQRRNILAEVEQSARGIMAGPRSTASATTNGVGFKRFNPAITAGYTMAVGKLAQVGLEAGALMSGAYSGAPGLTRLAAGYHAEHEFRPDGLVRLAFASRF